MNTDKKTFIVEEATKLFYQNGYKDTSLEMIAKACGIQKQAITYYFRSKEKLAIEVYSQKAKIMADAIVSKAAEKLQITDSKVLNAIPSMFIPALLARDPNVFKFYYDSEFTFLITPELNFEDLTIFWDLTKYLDNDKENMKYVFMDYIEMCYATNGIVIHYCKGKLDISEAELIEHFFKVRFGAFIKDKNRLEKFYEDVKSAYDKIDIIIKPNFEIECR